MEERGNTLEEEFFRKQNAELLEKMRVSREAETTRQTLADATGIKDEAVLDRLLAEGMTAASATALSVAPLVAVAWADRKLDDKERKAVIEGAEAAGVTAGTPGHALLQDWLTAQPPASLMETWKGYARSLSESLEPAQRTELRETVLARAKAVANAAGGGFAGMGSKLSAEEQKTLDEIAAAFSA